MHTTGIKLIICRNKQRFSLNTYLRNTNKNSILKTLIPSFLQLDYAY